MSPSPMYTAALGPPRAQVRSRPQGRHILGPVGPTIRQNAEAGIRPLEAGGDEVAGIRLNRPQHEDLIPEAVKVGGGRVSDVTPHKSRVRGGSEPDAGGGGPGGVASPG